MKKFLRKVILWILEDKDRHGFHCNYKYIHQFGELAALARIQCFSDSPQHPPVLENEIRKHDYEIKNMSKRINNIIRYIDNKIK